MKPEISNYYLEFSCLLVLRLIGDYGKFARV